MDTDRYGRTVALVQSLGGKGTLNEALVQQGYHNFSEAAYTVDALEESQLIDILSFYR